MVVSDETLNNLLAAIRINIGKQTPQVKKFASFIIVFYYIIMTYYSIASCAVMLSDLKSGVSCIFLSSVSMTIWYSLFRRRRKITFILKKLYEYRQRYDIRDNNQLFIKTVISILFLIKIIFTQTLQYPESLKSGKVLEFWALNYEIPIRFLGIPFIVFTNLSYFLLFSFPVLLTFILSIIFFKYAEVLEFYNKLLRFHLRNMKSDICSEHLSDFFRIIKILRIMTKVMSYPLFFIVMYSLDATFTSVYSLIKYKDASSYSFVSDAMILIISGFEMLMMYSVTSSMIPEKMHDIAVTAREKLNEHACGDVPFIPQNVQLCLRRIETESVTHISVCGLFRLSKSFILTAIGTIFTYDLLIVNIFLSE